MNKKNLSDQFFYFLSTWSPTVRWRLCTARGYRMTGVLRFLPNHMFEFSVVLRFWSWTRLIWDRVYAWLLCVNIENSSVSLRSPVTKTIWFYAWCMVVRKREREWGQTRMFTSVNVGFMTVIWFWLRQWERSWWIQAWGNVDVNSVDGIFVLQTKTVCLYWISFWSWVWTKETRVK